MTVELLDLTVHSFKIPTQQDLINMPDLTITLYFGHAKKPKKSSFELPIVLNDTNSLNVDIKSSDLDTLESFYDFFAHITNQNSKFLLFAKSDNYAIGSGFVSSNTHFLAFLIIGVREFLFISLNKDVFDRLTTGSLMIPSDLANLMKASLVGITTVTDVLNHRIQEDQNFFTQMNDNPIAAETIQSNPQIEKPPQLSKITVWTKYEVLLYSLNNIFFTIDNQFNDISRTRPLDEDLVKNICIEILKRHKNQENADSDNENE